MNQPSLAIHIEALLFTLGRPLSREELAEMFDASAENIEGAIAHLIEQGASGGRGIVLVDDGREVELRASSAAADTIERARRQALGSALGRAGAEAIAVLLYRGPSTRAEIDFVRGVNSSAALRTLLMRGLVRKADSRGTITYELTTELAAELGLTRLADAPELAAVRGRLAALERREEGGPGESNLR
ncbi:MAG: SMC-Scp complex subunit ScpB [Minisyncoccia bacterium]